MTISSALRYSTALLIWALIYYAAGVISLSFDDPASQVAIVWFPAGVAVAAFLCSRRAHWPLLFLILILMRIFLDNHWRHDFLSSVVISVLSLSANFLIAWIVRKFTRKNDDLQAILLWICSTLGVSTLGALAMAVWLTLARGLHLYQTFWVVWLANVTGIIFATVVLMGMLNINVRSASFSLRRKLCGILFWLLLCLSTWYIFGTTPSWLTTDLIHHVGTAMHFALALIPIMFAVATTVIWGNRGGALALLTLGAMVIYYTDHQIGPFFLKGLHYGEPLLLAQSYLTATALIIVFLRVLTQSVHSDDPDSDRKPGEGVMYQLYPDSGKLLWDSSLPELLDTAPENLSSVQRVIDQVHPEDREQLLRRWSFDTSTTALRPFTFRIRRKSGEWLSLVDGTPVRLTGAQGRVIVGNWQLSLHEK